MSPNMIRLVRLLLLLGAVVLWEIYARAFATSSLSAAPSQVLAQLWPKVLGEPRVRLAIGVTLIELIVAFGMSVVFGMLIGVLVGMTDIGRKSFYPVVLLLYGIPQAILLPLFVLVFGLGPASKIAFGFSHGVFPVIVNTIAGMRNVNPLYVRAATAMGAQRADIIRHVMFPHMATSFFTGLRLAMTTTLLGVILAELYVSTAGVGYFTKLFAENFDPAPLFALIGILAVMAIALNELARSVERRFTH